MIGTVLAAASLAASAPADAREAYARRQFLLDADTRCQLLTPREREALTGAAAQARGALQRAGIDPAPIAGAVAARAAGSACDDDLVQTESANARDAFRRWAATPRQDFPGDRRIWHASRYDADGVMAWTLWQDLGGGVRLGQVEDAKESALVLAMPAAPGAQPRTVAMEYRDVGKWPQYVDPTLGGLFSSPSESGLADRAAPPALAARLWTTGAWQTAVESPVDDQGFFYWTLPDQTLTALAALDPRDVARLAVEYTDNSSRIFYLEVGDLAAAQGFLAAGETPFSRGQSGS